MAANRQPNDIGTMGHLFRTWVIKVHGVVSKNLSVASFRSSEKGSYACRCFRSLRGDRSRVLLKICRIDMNKIHHRGSSVVGLLLAGIFR